MKTTVWHQTQDAKYRARLQLDRLTAEVDLLQPLCGMDRVCLAGCLLADASLLGVEMPSFDAGNADVLIEHCTRGADLSVAYRELELWPVRVEAVWRAVEESGLDTSVAAVDLVLSVGTSLLNSRPELTVQSRLPATEVLRLVEPRSARFEPLDLSLCKPVVLDSARGAGCLVFRLPEAALSYVEMVHPVDFDHEELDSGNGVRIRHRLFSQPLEKGVILRARVRGVFVPRAEDTPSAAECYRAFVTAEPPLSA